VFAGSSGHQFDPFARRRHAVQPHQGPFGGAFVSPGHPIHSRGWFGKHPIYLEEKREQAAAWQEQGSRLPE
jgi:hypothetical protein